MIESSKKRVGGVFNKILNNYKYKYGADFLLIYLSISVGAGLEVSGSNWDINWHALNQI